MLRSGKEDVLRPPRPLRTARESFPSSGSIVLCITMAAISREKGRRLILGVALPSKIYELVGDERC